jgi:hypothetical protein
VFRTQDSFLLKPAKLACGILNSELLFLKMINILNFRHFSGLTGLGLLKKPVFRYSFKDSITEKKETA